jgi:hypothetical protein
MGINVAWITETGEPKEQVLDPRQHLSRLAMERWQGLSGSKCIQFVEPWGDAVFNQSQIPHLLEELRSELEQVVDLEARAHLERIIELVARAVDETHTYVKFIGD